MSGPLDFGPDAADADGARRAPSAPPPARRPGHVWIVGVAAVVLCGALGLGLLLGTGGRGARGLALGQTIPPFAVPLALSDLDGDANLARHAGQGEAGGRPACSVRGPRVLNGCALTTGAPAVLAFFATRGSACVDQLDAIERVQDRIPSVRFAAVAIRGDRDGLRRLVREHGWTFPVGVDRDGALSAAFNVQVCPQLTFTRPGGGVAETTFGEIDDAALLVKARRLIQDAH